MAHRVTLVLNPNSMSIVFAGLTTVTDRQTARATRSVTIGYMYVRISPLRPNNNNNKASHLCNRCFRPAILGWRGRWSPSDRTVWSLAHAVRTKSLWARDWTEPAWTCKLVDEVALATKLTCQSRFILWWRHGRRCWWRWRARDHRLCTCH